MVAEQSSIMHTILNFNYNIFYVLLLLFILFIYYFLNFLVKNSTSNELHQVSPGTGATISKMEAKIASLKKKHELCKKKLCNVIF